MGRGSLWQAQLGGSVPLSIPPGLPGDTALWGGALSPGTGSQLCREGRDFVWWRQLSLGRAAPSWGCWAAGSHMQSEGLALGPVRTLLGLAAPSARERKDRAWWPLSSGPRSWDQLSTECPQAGEEASVHISELKLQACLRGLGPPLSGRQTWSEWPLQPRPHPLGTERRVADSGGRQGSRGLWAGVPVSSLLILPTCSPAPLPPLWVTLEEKIEGPWPSGGPGPGLVLCPPGEGPGRQPRVLAPPRPAHRRLRQEGRWPGV